MQCSKCNQDNPEGAKFCLECGNKFVSVSEQNRSSASLSQTDTTTLSYELRSLFEKDESAYWSRMNELSEDQPEQFVTISSEMLNNETLKDDAVLRFLRGRAYFKKAWSSFKPNADQFNNEALDLLEQALIDYKVAADSRGKEQLRGEIDEKIEVNIDSVATVLEQNRPGRVQTILGKLKLKYLDDRVYIWNQQFTPSEQEMALLGSVYFDYPEAVGSAMIFSKVLGEPGKRIVKVVLYKEATGPKNESGQTNEMLCIVQLSEDGKSQIIDDFGKKKAPDIKRQSEGRTSIAGTQSSFVKQEESSIEELSRTSNITKDLKKTAGDISSTLLSKSRMVKDSIAAGKHKELLNNEFVRTTLLWFRVSDVRLRIPVYMGWSIVVGLIIVSLGHERLSNVLSVVLTMAIYVYALGAVGGPLNWILDKVHKIPYSGLLTMPLFTIPWYVFGWPSEKLYGLFFHNFTCLGLGLKYLQSREYGKAVFELENAKVGGKDSEGQKVLHSALGDAYEGIGDYDKAVNAYSTAMQYDPNDSGLKMDLAYCLAMLDDFDKALKLFREVLQASPENTNAYLGMSRCYINMGMYADALPQLNHAFSLEPQNATMHKMLAEAHMALGNETEALKEAQLSLTLNPEPNIAEQAQEIIDHIQNEPAVAESKNKEPETVQSHDDKRESVETPASVPLITDSHEITDKEKDSAVRSAYQTTATSDANKNMHCSYPTCNKKIPADSVFCGYCGARVVLS